MSEQASNSPDGGDEVGIGTLGWVIIVIAVLLLLPVLVGFALGVAGLAVKLVFGAVAAIVGAIAAVFGIIVSVLGGILGAVLGILASMSVVLLLLLPGILVGLLLAGAFRRGRAD